MKLICKVPRMSRSNISARVSRPSTWRGGRQSRQAGDAVEIGEIRQIAGDLPSYGHSRIWGTFRTERSAPRPVPFNSRRIYRVIGKLGLPMHRRLILPRLQRRHDGKVAVARSNQRWCAGGVEFRRDNDEPLRAHCILFRLREFIRYVWENDGRPV